MDKIDTKRSFLIKGQHRAEQDRILKEGIHNEKAHFNPLFGLRSDPMICLFLSIITLAVYCQVIDFEFTNFDDKAYLTDNPHIQHGLTLRSLIWSFTATYASNWHPLTWLSHILDVQLYGMNPGRHHITNVLFHMANTLLLFFVFRRMTGAFRQSAFVAALFALHPLHVESVAWVAERKNVLCAFFWFLTMWGYVRYVERPGLKRYLLVSLFFILGLMAKPMLVTLPFVLLLLDFWPLDRFRSKHARIWPLVIEKTPLFLFTAASSVITFTVQKAGGSVSTLSLYPFFLRIENALISYVIYIGKMMWPFHLAVFYPYPQTVPWWHTTGAFLFLVSVSLLVVKSLKRRPYLAVGWIWYLGTLVPVIGIVQVGHQAMADKYAYVALIGLFIILAWGVPDLLHRWRYRKAGVAFIATVALLVLMIIAWFQTRHWASSITLFEHAIHVTENNSIAHNNLGSALGNKGRHTEAIRHFSEAVNIRPSYWEAHNNLGFALMAKGYALEAIKHFSEALRIYPKSAVAYNGLGVAYARQGKGTEAIKYFSEAVRIFPKYADAYSNLGVALQNEGRLNEAIRHYDAAIKINPSNVHAHYNMGVCLTNQGRHKDAIRHFTIVLRIDPAHSEASNALRNALSLLNRKKGE